MTTIRVTRTTRLGFGYRTGIIPNTTTPDVPSVPDYTGTVRTLSRRIIRDQTLQVIRSGGTYYGWAFFLRDTSGIWHTVHTDSHAWDMLWVNDALYNPMCIHPYIDVPVYDN